MLSEPPSATASAATSELIARFDGTRATARANTGNLELLTAARSCASKSLRLALRVAAARAACSGGVTGSRAPASSKVGAAADTGVRARWSPGSAHVRQAS
jgi:hypothetical protein